MSNWSSSGNDSMILVENSEKENSEKENGEENSEKEYSEKENSEKENSERENNWKGKERKENSEKENSEWFKRCHYQNSIVSILTDHSSTSTFYSALNKEKFLTLKIYIG